MSDLSVENQFTCVSESNTLCTACSSRDNCNIDTVRRDELCLVCNSALDPTCSQQPSEVIAEHCQTPSNGQCFSRIQNGATVRGCMGSLTSADQCRNATQNSVLVPSTQCYAYSGGSSNNKVIPTDRLKCYHCDSHIDAACLEKPTESTPLLPCIKFVQPENCLKLVLSDKSSELNELNFKKFPMLINIFPSYSCSWLRFRF